MKGIEIVGGGLAGLSLGIALRRHEVPVTIREATTYPRHRVCGEFINGVTSQTLENLGVASLFSDALLHRKTRWWMGSRQILEASLERPALGMSRWEMDERLRVCFESLGGILQTRDRVSREAKVGRVWTAGRRLEKESHWLGLKAHFEGVDLEECLEMHIGSTGYVGLTPIRADGLRVNVCGLFQRGPRGGKGNPIVTALRRSGLEKLAVRLEEAEMDEKSLTGVSGFQLGAQRVDSDLCLLGDAERMIPPFTGNGMSMAFESAECALEPLLLYERGDRSWEESVGLIQVSLEERFQKRVQLALRLHRFLTNATGRSSLAMAARMKILPFHWLQRRLS